MKLDVELGGRRRSWRIPGADPVAAWLSASPWSVHAQPRFVHLPVEAVEPCLDGLRGLVRLAAHDSDVRLEIAAGRETPAQSFASWMGVAVGSYRHLAEELARVMDLRERALLFTLSDNVVPAIWADKLQAFLDLYQKLPEAPPFCVMVAVVGASVELGYDHLDMGWPEHHGASLVRVERWTAYLHERVAWHTGGSLELAYEVGAVLDGVAVGADRDLERVFDECALRSFSRLPEAIQQHLGTSLARLLSEPKIQLKPWVSGVDATSPRPTPWLARALLQRYPNHPMGSFLRAMRTCRPLAARLFGRCSDLEQRCRDHLLLQPPEGAPSAKAVAGFERYRDGTATEYSLAPAPLPAVSEPWQFATFGELIGSAALPHQVKQAMHDLRRVRNALAHGCSVGWRAVEKVAQLERELERHLNTS